MLRIIPASDPSLADALRREFTVSEEVRLAVANILTAVRERGDRALAEFTARFDGVELAPEEGFRVGAAEIKAAYRRVEPEFLDALRLAKERIAAFHRRQLSASWFETSAEGIVGGQLIRPLDRVGIYVPGGRATYPSSVLMNALPAVVAGVREIAMVTPPARDGSVNPYTLVAAAEAGVTEVYRVGGAQAIAALAYGTESIRRVDKITGPGNIYVTVAKQQVFGLVGIDMLAGPSEVVIVADGDADPAAVAADLLAQAEHDVLARAVLITPSWELGRAVREEVVRQLEGHRERRVILERALADGGLIIITRDLEEAIGLANRYAPEHLELMVAEPLAWLGRVRHAGAVFLGGYTPVALGDYAAGPNHVLPTGGTARFTSALGVDAFLKRINVLSCDRDGFGHLAPAVAVLAGVEGLPAHAAAVLVRGAKGGKEGRE